MLIRKGIVILCSLLFIVFNTGARDITIIPLPNECISSPEGFLIDKNVPVIAGAGGRSDTSVERLKTFIKKRYGIDLKKVVGSKGIRKAIWFEQDPDFLKEQYRLKIDASGIRIVASGDAGWFYGLQSLYQILPEQLPIGGQGAAVWVQGIEINDKPRFGWRAFMLDEARYFKGKERVKVLLDEMALLKMNVFHWHLVNDEGWRIEIKKYPRLTQVGAVRRSSQIGPLKWKSPIQSGEVHQGFYTQDDIREIIRYAQERHITVIPEIEMPGHGSAAIVSYPFLGTTKKKFEMPTTFFQKMDIYDVSDPRVFEFLTDVLDEVTNLFPSKIIHIGGDEALQNFWKESAAVRAYMQENQLNTTGELQMFFMNRIIVYLKQRGVRAMGWNELLGHRVHDYVAASDAKSTLSLSGNPIVHFWTGDTALLRDAAAKGYDIVNAYSNDTYLDYDYEQIPLSRAYAFDPVPKGFDERLEKKILGLGCQMWGEWIPAVGQMQYMIFPRIAAYAEVGWTRIAQKNYEGFRQRLQIAKTRWARKGIYFADM
ncbi:beta-N-acetylhexosaminidase [Niabella sp. CC-SYL272]|uniref:beta-N-acetylhexosaminidase n=1 Tax=Niabella agricola TaxID=2891571 RepID=UPI001F2351A8|nr:beta-N-acetylhexosaminidase [Niabella agricola]MCF3108093.1 beta-N-acetylhexosaminidase [Niabella agricola]